MNRYFDNASTSYPKPSTVAKAISHYLKYEGGTYGRAAYNRIFQASAMMEDCRDLLALKMNIHEPEKIFFAMNATMASNTILLGLDLKGQVWVSPMEHNAVMRPLELLKEKGKIEIHVFPHDENGLIDLSVLPTLSSEEVSLIVLNHQSNVNGVIQPIKSLKSKYAEIPVMVDLTQSLGAVSVDIESWGIDYAVFTGHKHLFGPTGIGGGYIRHTETVQPFLYGGTGSNSESFEMPSFLPDKYEAGTPNMVGIVGLKAALETTIEPCHKEPDFFEMLQEIKSIPNIELYCSNNRDSQGELFSIRPYKESLSTFSNRLINDFKLEVRTGLHCAPLAHRTIGTFPTGTVRIALSPFHTVRDMEYLVSAIKKCV